MAPVAGPGGPVSVDAGTFNMSNTMSSVGQSAAGIMVAAQNSGISALIQQSVNVQSNLTWVTKQGAGRWRVRLSWKGRQLCPSFQPFCRRHCGAGL
jgi:hypothetical protein